MNRRSALAAVGAVAVTLSAATGAIVGARRPGQMKGIVGAAGFRLSLSELAEIDAFFTKPAATEKSKQLVSR